jgi:hypothetical protein
MPVPQPVPGAAAELVDLDAGDDELVAADLAELGAVDIVRLEQLQLERHLALVAAVLADPPDQDLARLEHRAPRQGLEAVEVELVLEVALLAELLPDLGHRLRRRAMMPVPIDAETSFAIARFAYGLLRTWSRERLRSVVSAGAISAFAEVLAVVQPLVRRVIRPPS